MFGTGLSEVSGGLFCACFLQNMLNFKIVLFVFFPLTLGLQSKKSSYFYGTAHIFHPYF